MAFYSYTEIDEIGALYNLIIGQRSNGKTFGALQKVVDAYLDEGLPSAYIRRLDESIKPSKIDTLFDPHAEYVKEKTGGKWNGFLYRGNAFYLARYDTSPTTGRQVLKAKDIKPICRTYAISTADTDKGPDRGPVKYIIFDEFMTRKFYLVNEFVLFQQVLASIIRGRTGIKIYMLANTVNKFCPYFKEMGLRNVQDQQQGTIDVYRLGQTDAKIAVEYCRYEEDSRTKEVSNYFAFDNPQLKMITSGAWEIALYRHPPQGLGDYQIIFTFFILFSGKILQGDIYNYKSYPIIVFHPKTTELQHPARDLIYQEEQEDGNPLHQISLSAGQTKAHIWIRRLISENKTFFDSNETGEVFNSWLKVATRNQLIKG